MYRFVLKRLLLMIPIVIGVSFLIFTILNLIPGDPASNILGVGAVQADIDALNEELLLQYEKWEALNRYYFNSYSFLIKNNPMGLIKTQNIIES